MPKPPFTADFVEREQPPEAPFPNAPIPRGLARRTIRYFINLRWLEVFNNPDLLLDRTRRKDQSDIFYPTRTLLNAKGYNVDSLSEKGTREDLYDYIKQYCEIREIKRHQIGIFAAERAVLAYKGQIYDVSYENYKSLARLGCDLVCIEKEGLVRKWAPFTEKVGIALLHSEGFISEYGQMLAEEAKKTGINVMVLTDFDSDGIRIGFILEGITRIGIDFDSVKEINEMIKKELDKGRTGVAQDEDAEDLDDETIYKPDNNDFEPPTSKIKELDLNSPALVENRKENDSYTNLKRLTEMKKKKEC